MPSPWAAARASSMAETPQQALNASSGSGSQAGHRFIVRTTTSWTSAANSAAATELSTPPLIATANLATSYTPTTGLGSTCTSSWRVMYRTYCDYNINI